ncbi:SDR family NAD(P)-dependent oxidoreductase [Streptomyces sp. NPDC058221]|uniref:SDR family NAD(P)-dependent oxidoreductase n=1 Tax=Streptomyces sp. NPDC058221 TaxID=3346388 RepID=UPI0036E00E15
MSTNLRLDGMTVFLTGAGNGLGRASAIKLASYGAHIACTDRDPDAAESAAEQIRGSGGTATGYRLDVTDRRAVADTVDQAVQDGPGGLHGLVTCAGVPGDNATVENLDLASFQRIFAVHFRGTLHAVQAALPHLKASGGGSVVTLASGAIDRPFPGSGAYSMSKAAIAMLTKTLAAEAGRDGVRANVVAPGFIPTGLSMADHDTDEDTRGRFLTGWARQSPMKTVGVPDDVADQVLYLLSPAAAFVTGQTLRANGGAAMPW